MSMEDFGEQMHVRGRLQALLELQLHIQKQVNELKLLIKEEEKIK